MFHRASRMSLLWAQSAMTGFRICVPYGRPPSVSTTMYLTYHRASGTSLPWWPPVQHPRRSAVTR
jgi:hypothetical protein